MVYLARDTQLDRDVAFALIKTHGLDDVSRTRLSREAFRAELHYELAVVAFLENDPVKAAKSYESLLPFRNTIVGGTPPID